MSPIHVLFALLIFGVEFASQMVADSDKPPKKSRDWLIPVKGAILRKLAQYAASLAKILFRLKVINVPTEIKISKAAREQSYDPAGFVEHEKEFCKENLWKDFGAPEAASYKLVACPGFVGLLEVLLIALTRRWGIANYDELRAVESQCSLQDIGLGESFNVIALGTVVKRKTVSCSYCVPRVTYYANQMTKEREKKLSLHDLLFDMVSPGTYILFRVKAKKK